MADRSAYQIGHLNVKNLAEITNPLPGATFAWVETTNTGYRCIAGAVPGPIAWESITSPGGGIYTLQVSWNGTIQSGYELIPNLPVTDPFTIFAGAPSSYGRVKIAPTSTAVFDLKKNGSSFGTMQFAAAANTATFTVSSDTAFVAGDYYGFVAPSPADATLAGLGMALRGVR